MAFLVAGSGWRLLAIALRPAAADLSQPRADAAHHGALRGILRRMAHPAALRARSLPSTIFGYAYHVGLAIVFFGFTPHIAFVHRLTGASWPALSEPLFVAGVALTFVGLLYALMARLTSPVRRFLSTFDDYASWLLVFLPMVTGMAALTLPLDAAYPLLPERPLVVALHLLALEALLAWLPFGKLAHAYLVFFSRAATGAAFARKGATP